MIVFNSSLGIKIKYVDYSWSNMKSTGTAGSLHYYNNLDCPTQVNKNNYVGASILSASSIGLFATLQFGNDGKIQINTSAQNTKGDGSCSLRLFYME